MNLWEMLKVSKGLSSADYSTMLFRRKTGKKVAQEVTVSGVPCVLENAVGRPSISYRIYGNTVGGQSVGDVVFAEIQDKNGFILVDADGFELHSNDVSGYKITVVTNGENREPVRTSILLDEPLKTGEILKYPENILARADGTEETIKLPKIPMFSGTATIETDTEIQPSDMEITYKFRR